MSSKIMAIAMDVDGTMTDGSINISSNGELFKSFNVRDGMGIKMAMARGVVPAIITGRNSEIVEYRAKELGIVELYQGVNDKKAIVVKLCEKLSIKPENVAYIGDDINDLDAMECAGIAFAPLDAVDEVKNSVDVLLTKTGGNGAVRECIDYLIKNNYI